MNVCIVTYSVYEIDQRVIRYAEALQARGDAVDVVSLAGAPTERGSHTVRGLRIFRIQYRKHNERHPLEFALRLLFFFVKGSVLIIRNHLGRAYDLVHVNNIPDFLVFMAAVPKAFGARVLLDIHDIVPELFCQKFSKKMDSPVARLLRLVEKVSVRYADGVIAANDIWRERIVDRNRLDPCRSIALLNYPDLDVFREKPITESHGGGGPELVYAGTLSRQHGVDLLIRALAAAIVRIPDLRLHIFARGGHEKKDLDELVATLGLEDSVFFHEPVPAKSLGTILGGQQIGLVPKRDGIFSGDAFSSKIFDYMAAGIPIIASKTRIDQFYFHDRMIRFFEAGNISSLADCIVELCTSAEVRARLVGHYEEFLFSNTWQRRRQEYYRIVDKIMESPRRQRAAATRP